MAKHMTVETLVVTLQQDGEALVKRMNIQTPAVVGKQCGEDKLDKFEYNGNEIRVVSTSTRGVGINRNEVIMRSKADVLVLADDDMTFLDGYETIVKHWAEQFPEADVLVFNLKEEKPRRYVNTTVRKIHRFNYAKYGAARLVLRKESIAFSGIMFNTMFGGGCRYSCGEDTIFLRECLRKGLKIMAVPATLAAIKDGDSTWFTGYTDKYFYDKGILYYALSKKTCKINAMIHGIRYRKKYREYGWKNAVKQMWKGIDSLR